MTAIHPRTYKRPALSDEEIQRIRADVPDQPVRLQSGWLSCRTCGIAVPRTADVADEIHVETLTSLPEGTAALTQASQKQRLVPLTFTFCSDHRRIAELASELIANPAHRSLRSRVGIDVAEYQVNCALDALSFVAPDKVEHVAYIDPEGLMSLIRHLASLGATSRWINRFYPVMSEEANTATCSPYSWAHLMPGQRQTLRKAYADLLRERTSRSAPAVLIAPPRVTDIGNPASPLVVIQGGCLLCGVSHQKVSAAAVVRAPSRESVAAEVWMPKQVSTEQLGGRRSAQQLSGHLCRSCDDACSTTNSIGPTALERALVAALAPQGAGLLGYGQLDVKGLAGWGALVARARQQGEPDPRPNTEAWAHLGDLGELREQLAYALS
jgi:hypothetical protein